MAAHKALLDTLRPTQTSLRPGTCLRSRTGVVLRPRTLSTSLASAASTISHAGNLSSGPHQKEKHQNGETRRSRRPLTAEQRAYIASALRVNQAGELAATLIYAGQTPPVVGREPRLRGLMRHMREQEEGHLATFEALVARHRVRPTALYPAWTVVASGLGWATGVMGREAAMACTEAVETEIGGHYNGQIRRLLEMMAAWEADGFEAGDELRELVATLRRIRDEELEHLDHAVDHDAKKAEPHWLLTGVIRAGCKGAIWLSERV